MRDFDEFFNYSNNNTNSKIFAIKLLIPSYTFGIPPTKAYFSQHEESHRTPK
jgi:hypothetical protein